MCAWGGKRAKHTPPKKKKEKEKEHHGMLQSFASSGLSQMTETLGLDLKLKKYSYILKFRQDLLKYTPCVALVFQGLI